MTVRDIMDANSLISVRLILLQLNAHVHKITLNFNRHLQPFNNFAAKTLLLFYL